MNEGCEIWVIHFDSGVVGFSIEAAGGRWLFLYLIYLLYQMRQRLYTQSENK